MKKLLGIVVLGLLVCSVTFAEKYPELKSPLVSIAGKTPKKLKVPGKINLKDFKVNKSGSKIYMDINERQKKLKKFKYKARLCRLENNFAAKVKNSKQTGKNILIDPIIEGRGFKWQEGATPITGENQATSMIINTDQLSSHWMVSGETVYLDVLKDQLLLWAKADAYQVLISDGQAWGGNFGYIDKLEFVLQNLARMLFV